MWLQPVINAHRDKTTQFKLNQSPSRYLYLFTSWKINLLAGLVLTFIFHHSTLFCWTVWYSTWFGAWIFLWFSNWDKEGTFLSTLVQLCHTQARTNHIWPMKRICMWYPKRRICFYPNLDWCRRDPQEGFTPTPYLERFKTCLYDPKESKIVNDTGIGKLQKWFPKEYQTWGGTFFVPYWVGWCVCDNRRVSDVVQQWGLTTEARLSVVNSAHCNILW